MPDISEDLGVEASERDWKRLGEEMLLRRKRLRLSREALAKLTGGAVTARTIGNYEHARLPVKGGIPAGYYAVERALGWTEGSIEEVLAGRAPTMQGETPAPAAAQAAADPEALIGEVMTEYGHVLGFGELCERAGGGASERDAFDVAARRLAESVPGVRLAVLWRRGVALAASRPHGEGEYAPSDDVARAYRAVDDADDPQE